MRKLQTLGEFRVDPDGLRLVGPAGEEKLESLTMDVLRCLMQRPGQVVSVNEIVEQVWRGGVVADNAVHKRVAQLRKILGDDPKAPNYIETIPRKGYRLLPEPRPFEESTRAAAQASSRTPRPAFVAGLITVIAAIGVLFWWFPEDRIPDSHPVEAHISSEASAPDTGGRSLLVLPFNAQNFDDPILQEIMADEFRGILTDDPGLQVLSRGSANEIAASGQDPRLMARSLDVELLVEGQLLGSGTEATFLSVAATDTASGFEVWSSRAEFGGSEDTYAALTAARGAAIDLRRSLMGIRPDVTEAPPFDDVDLLQSYMLAMHRLNLGSLDDLDVAEEQFRALLAERPGSYQATLGLARTLLERSSRQTEQRGELLAEAEYLAEQALRLQPDAPEIGALLGWIRFARGQQAIGLRDLQEAVARNPDMPWGTERLSRALIASNRPTEARQVLESAMRLHPLDQILNIRLAELFAGLGDRAAAHRILDRALEFPQPGYEVRLAGAQIDFQYNRFGEAAERAVGVLAVAGDDYRPAARLSLCLAALGQFEQAEAWAEAAARLSPRSPFVRSARFYNAYFQEQLSDAYLIEALPDLEAPRSLALEERVAIGLYGLRELTLDRWTEAERAFRKLDLFAEQRAITQAADLFMMGNWLLAAERSGAPDLAAIRDQGVTALEAMLDAGWHLPAIHYYGGRLYALAGRSTQAEEQFLAAADIGWRHFHAMRADPARSMLETLPAFRTLLETARAGIDDQARAVRSLQTAVER